MYHNIYLVHVMGHQIQSSYVGGEYWQRASLVKGKFSTGNIGAEKYRVLTICR